jgi:uncharacterized LabA/DUF88 family protein
MAPGPLPKPNSAAMRQLRATLAEALDIPRTIVVLEGALDRKTLEAQLQKTSRGSLGRTASLSKAEVVGRLADLFFRDENTGIALMRDLDKSCHKERHIVASIHESALDERLQSYRALDFRRERARLVWALLRDGRDAHRLAASRILTEAFATAAVTAHADELVATARAEMDSGAPASAGPDAQAGLQGAARSEVMAAFPEVVSSLKERLQGTESTLQQQQDRLAAELARNNALERERAELMARAGSLSRALKDEEQLRRAAEAESTGLRGRLSAAEARLSEHDTAVADTLAEENLRLRERVRSLERQASHQSRAPELHEELEALKRAQADSARQHERALAVVADQLRAAEAREQAAQQRAEELREQLKTARQLLAQGPRQAPPRPPGALPRVGVFLDDANLSASARRDLGSRLDYQSLLPALLAERALGCAVAFVVDGKDTDHNRHQAFVHRLRGHGYDVREKRLKVRSDGSRKADWDMGMAMEILDNLGDLDVIVLGSGDGDFVPLVKRLRREGRRVEVAAFRSATDEALVGAADAFVGLDGRFRLA